MHTLQDIMRLDNSARMNTPGRAAGNWAWRVGGSGIWQQLQPEAAALRRLAYVYDRMPKGVEIDLVAAEAKEKAKAGGSSST